MQTFSRRAVFALLAGAMPVALVAKLSAQTNVENKTPDFEAGFRPAELISLERRYKRFKKEWMVERNDYVFSSQIETYWDGPVGQAIIAMGPRILPLVVSELRRGDFFFNYPMQVFAGFLLGGNDLDSEQERSKLWIRWYDELSSIDDE